MSRTDSLTVNQRVNTMQPIRALHWLTFFSPARHVKIKPCPCSVGPSPAWPCPAGTLPFSAVISWCCHLTVKLYIWHYSGPCSDVCHLGHSKNLWTELNWGWARPSPSSAYLKYHFTLECSPGRKWGNVWHWNSSEEFEHNLHTGKVHISEQLEKVMSFNLNLSKLLLKDAQYVPSMDKVDNAVLLHHHHTILHFCLPSFKCHSTVRQLTAWTENCTHINISINF